MSRELKARIMCKRCPNEWLKIEYTLGQLIEMDGAGFISDDDVIEIGTGLKDENGKEIYEGDIVRFGDSIAIIIWRDERAEFGVRWMDCGVEDSLGWQFEVEQTPSEVIGNIHEPPKDFSPEQLKRMGVTMVKGGEE